MEEEEDSLGSGGSARVTESGRETHNMAYRPST